MGLLGDIWNGVMDLFGLGTSAVQTAQNYQINQQNYDLALKNYQFQKDSYNKSFGLQQDAFNLQKDSYLKNYQLQKDAFQFQKDSYLKNFGYQQALQNQIFAREDNAIQRRAADLQAAGLSKTLAAGSGAGAGSVVSTSPFTGSFDGSAFSGGFSGSGFGGKAPERSAVDLLSTAMSFAQASASIKKVNAEAENLLKQNEKMDSDMLVNDAQTAWIKAKTAVEEGQLSILSLTGQQIQTTIDYTKGLMNKVDVEIKALQNGIRKSDWEYRYLLPQELQYKVEQVANLRREGRYITANTVYKDLQSDLLTQQIFEKEWQNKILELDYNYQQQTGFKPAPNNNWIVNLGAGLSQSGLVQKAVEAVFPNLYNGRRTNLRITHDNTPR